MIEPPVRQTLSTGSPRAYAAVMAGLWIDLELTLARLDALAADTERLLDDRAPAGARHRGRDGRVGARARRRAARALAARGAHARGHGRRLAVAAAVTSGPRSPFHLYNI